MPHAVVYCPNCTFPPEYCEYGPCYDKCKPWLKQHFPHILEAAAAEKKNESKAKSPKQSPKAEKKAASKPAAAVPSRSAFLKSPSKQSPKKSAAPSRSAFVKSPNKQSPKAEKKVASKSTAAPAPSRSAFAKSPVKAISKGVAKMSVKQAPSPPAQIISKRKVFENPRSKATKSLLKSVRRGPKVRDLDAEDEATRLRAEMSKHGGGQDEDEEEEEEDEDEDEEEEDEEEEEEEEKPKKKSPVKAPSAAKGKSPAKSPKKSQAKSPAKPVGKSPRKSPRSLGKSPKKSPAKSPSAAAAAAPAPATEEAPESKAAPQKKGKKGPEPEVLISRVSRNKRKSITTIQGLDLFGVNLKNLAKTFSTKFACGVAVKPKEGAPDKEVIVIQGDVQYDLADLANEELKIPQNKIFFVEKGKKTPAF